MVVRVFLRAAGRLLRVAAAARSDGHRRRREESALAVHRHLRHAAGGATALRRAGRTAAARALHSHRLSFLRGQHRAVLGAAHLRHCAHRRRAGVFRLGQRVQSVRGRGVLVVHGRPVQLRAGQAAVRIHRRRRHGGRAARPDHHDLAFGSARSGEPADRRRATAGTGGVLRLPPRARGDGARRAAAGDAKDRRRSFRRPH